MIGIGARSNRRRIGARSIGIGSYCRCIRSTGNSCCSQCCRIGLIGIGARSNRRRIGARSIGIGSYRRGIRLI
nr:hypothetical protein [Synechococcus sp. UW179A]